jgi:hypothetical protein
VHELKVMVERRAKGEISKSLSSLGQFNPLLPKGERDLKI